ncbi:cardiotrophin-2-like [Lemur catta]|uniref:cardiotrophin-2-like n=1 Tax=Lemur catta TaxID=9447 RepID=UPI001E2693D0|nr:cardiotrophin-2-like [Lemur catta]
MPKLMMKKAPAAPSLGDPVEDPLPQKPSFSSTSSLFQLAVQIWGTSPSSPQLGSESALALLCDSRSLPTAHPPPEGIAPSLPVGRPQGSAPGIKPPESEGTTEAGQCPPPTLASGPWLSLTQSLGGQLSLHPLETSKSFHIEGFIHRSSDKYLLSAYYVLGPICLLMLLLPLLSPAAPISPAGPISQAYSLALYMQKNTSTLLQTYLQYQGSPFSDPGFSAPELQLSSLPPASISFKIWHALDDGERLSRAQWAFLALTQHLQLVGEDQSDLNPGSPILLAQLGAARLRSQGLLGNMAAIMTALGLPIPPEEDTLGLVPFGASAFERKCRGYIVTREYGHWTDRAVRDLALLKAKYPA